MSQESDENRKVLLMLLALIAGCKLTKKEKKTPVAIKEKPVEIEIEINNPESEKPNIEIHNLDPVTVRQKILDAASGIIPSFRYIAGTFGIGFAIMILDASVRYGYNLYVNNQTTEEEWGEEEDSNEYINLDEEIDYQFDEQIRGLKIQLMKSTQKDKINEIHDKIKELEYQKKLSQEKIEEQKENVIDLDKDDKGKEEKEITKEINNSLINLANQEEKKIKANLSATEYLKQLEERTLKKIEQYNNNRGNQRREREAVQEGIRNAPSAAPIINEIAEAEEMLRIPIRNLAAASNHLVMSSNKENFEYIKHQQAYITQAQNNVVSLRDYEKEKKNENEEIIEIPRSNSNNIVSLRDYEKENENEEFIPIPRSNRNSIGGPGSGGGSNTNIIDLYGRLSYINCNIQELQDSNRNSEARRNLYRRFIEYNRPTRNPIYQWGSGNNLPFQSNINSPEKLRRHRAHFFENMAIPQTPNILAIEDKDDKGKEEKDDKDKEEKDNTPIEEEQSTYRFEIPDIPPIPSLTQSERTLILNFDINEEMQEYIFETPFLQLLNNIIQNQQDEVINIGDDRAISDEILGRYEQFLDSYTLQQIKQFINLFNDEINEMYTTLAKDLLNLINIGKLNNFNVGAIRKKYLKKKRDVISTLFEKIAELISSMKIKQENIILSLLESAKTAIQKKILNGIDIKINVVKRNIQALIKISDKLSNESDVENFYKKMFDVLFTQYTELLISFAEKIKIDNTDVGTDNWITRAEIYLNSSPNVDLIMLLKELIEVRNIFLSIKYIIDNPQFSQPYFTLIARFNFLQYIMLSRVRSLTNNEIEEYNKLLNNDFIKIFIYYAKENNIPNIKNILTLIIQFEEKK